MASIKPRRAIEWAFALSIALAIAGTILGVWRGGAGEEAAAKPARTRPGARRAVHHARTYRSAGRARGRAGQLLPRAAELAGEGGWLVDGAGHGPAVQVTPPEDAASRDRLNDTRELSLRPATRHALMLLAQGRGDRCSRFLAYTWFAMALEVLVLAGTIAAWALSYVHRCGRLAA